MSEESSMPRYEIVVHLRCELEGDTAEDAAALFRRRLLTETGVADDLLHLAVWRQEQQPAASALPEALRLQLSEFFAALDRCASEAEEDFRDRVAAILAGSAQGDEPAIDATAVTTSAAGSAERRTASS
jgi:hypothetical protein